MDDDLSQQSTGLHVHVLDDAFMTWIEQVLPETSPRLLGRTSLDEPFAQLPIAQFRLLKALPDDEIGLKMGKLCEKLMIKASALTQVADRIIRQGLAERVDDPLDRRSVRLRLTSAGRQQMHERSERRRARLERIWRSISPTEQEEFLNAVRVLERIGRKADALIASAQQGIHPEIDDIDRD